LNFSDDYDDGDDHNNNNNSNHIVYYCTILIIIIIILMSQKVVEGKENITNVCSNTVGQLTVIGWQTNCLSVFE